MAKKNTEIMLREILDWFLYGDVGESSKAIVAAALNMENDNRISYPHDDDDLNRCYLLIGKIPETKIGLEKLAKIHPNWKVIFENWDELAKLFALDRSRCYRLMQKLYLGIVHENEVQISKGLTIITNFGKGF